MAGRLSGASGIRAMIYSREPRQGWMARSPPERCVFSRRHRVVLEGGGGSRRLRPLAGSARPPGAG